MKSIMRLAATLLALSLFFVAEKSASAQILRCVTDGVAMNGRIDPKSWYVSLSASTFMFLYENGSIGEDEVTGTYSMKISTGETKTVLGLKLKMFMVEGKSYDGIRACVIDNQNVPVLIGLSALPGEEEYMEDLITKAKEDEAVKAWSDSMAHANKNLAIKYFNEKSYNLAADKFARLKDAGQLDSRSTYFYICTLAFSGDYRRCVDEGEAWLKENDGNPNQATVEMLVGASYQQLGEKDKAIRYKKLYLERTVPDKDYGTYINVLLSLGSCLNGIDETEALNYYKKAFELVSDHGGFTEKMVSDGLIQDEAAATALYGMGISALRSGNKKDGRRWMVDAALCGNADAADFCRKISWRLKR